MTFQSESVVTYNCKNELIASEKYLVNYNEMIVVLLLQSLKSGDFTAEFGAGIGVLTKLVSKKYKVSPHCIEIDDNFKKILRKEGFVCYNNIEDSGLKYDYVYSSNVLEHVEDDITALQNISNSIKPGGYLAMYLPAFMSLYSDYDIKTGHFRRYGRAEIVSKFNASGFDVQKFCYVDSVGFFLWYAIKIKNKVFSSETDMGNGRMLIAYDRYILPISNFLDRIIFRKLLGKNLLIIGRKI